MAERKPQRKKKPKREKPLRIPLPFDQAVAGLLAVKPKKRKK
jgi:hypothetical protein